MFKNGKAKCIDSHGERQKMLKRHGIEHYKLAVTREDMESSEYEDKEIQGYIGVPALNAGNLNKTEILMTG
jgi:hypothetical protein